MCIWACSFRFSLLSTIQVTNKTNSWKWTANDTISGWTNKHINEKWLLVSLAYTYNQWQKKKKKKKRRKIQWIAGRLGAWCKLTWFALSARYIIACEYAWLFGHKPNEQFPNRIRALCTIYILYSTRHSHIIFFSILFFSSHSRGPFHSFCVTLNREMHCYWKLNVQIHFFTSYGSM